MERALPAMRVAFYLGSAIGLAIAIALALRLGHSGWHDAGDAYDYWRAWDGGLYDKPWFAGSFIYSPVIAQLLWPLTLFPFEMFRGLLMAASIGALVYMVGPRAAGFVALLFPGVIGDLAVGSPHLLMAAALVAGVRDHAAGWAMMPLTKVTPSIVWLWLLRDGRQVRRAILFMLIVCGVSFLAAPQLWFDWARLLIDAAARHPGDPTNLLIAAPLVLRLPIGFAIAGIATWRGWAWLLPVAALVTLPAVWGAGMALLVACWPLRPEWVLRQLGNPKPAMDAASALKRRRATRREPAEFEGVRSRS